MFKNRTFSFVKHFKIFLLIGIIFMATGIIGIVTLPFGVNLFNMDVDFLGGVTTTYDLGQQVDSQEVESLARDVLEDKLSSVTTSGDTGTQVVIKSLFVPEETRDALTASIRETYPDAEVVSSSFLFLLRSVRILEILRYFLPWWRLCACWCILESALTFAPDWRLSLRCVMTFWRCFQPM